MRFSLFLFLLLILAAPTFAQTHHALTGSRYAGSLGMYQNPASTLSSADTTDFSLANLHFNTYTNFIDFGYTPLFSKNPAITLEPSKGDYPRELITNFNVNLLSFKRKLNQKTAIGFGMNLRSMININSSHYTLTDSTSDIIYFIEQNSKSLPFQGSATTSNWFEYVMNLSHNFVDSRKYMLNVGSNLRVNRGLAGMIGSLGNLQFRKYNFLGIDAYEITNADFIYGISATATQWDNSLRIIENYRKLKNKMKTGASLDLGAELLIKKEKESDWFYEGVDYNYFWKLGFSITDLGFTKYEYFSESAKSTGMKQNITPEVLIDKFFGSVSNISDFNDSIATVVGRFEHLKGNFNIYNPTRFNLNVDHKINSLFYVNAALSLPFSLLNRNSVYKINDIAYCSITPRIENRNVGLYLPLSYNIKTKMKIGLAFRTGPLIIGLNNLNIFHNSTDLQNTSAYINLLFRWRKKEKKLQYNFIKSPKRVL